MSGTSLDGVDVACCEFDPAFRLVAHHYQTMPDDLGSQLLHLQSPSEDEIHHSMLVSGDLARWYAHAVGDLLNTYALHSHNICAIGCHGQTIRHRPREGYTVQLNQPALLAELSTIDVVADFRSRDIAASGQGAPLVPALHEALFRRSDTHRVIVNIGGMANLTNLPPHGNTNGFDCGPGNVLMDGWIKAERQHPFDTDGKWAANGRVQVDLLNKLRAHPFLHLAPPKSCGREEFNLQWLHQQLSGNEQAEDVQATLLELTASSIADAIRGACIGSTEVYYAGGGAKNSTLMTRLAQLLPDHKTDTTASLGVPVDALEAIAFAWLAKQFVDRQPGNLPEVTGARGPRILGALYPA